MIEPKELRIGNYVNFKSKHCKINTLNKLISSIYYKNERSIINYIDLKPIPLTEEILLKCGFEINKNHCTKWINNINTFIISQRKNKIWFLCDTDINTGFMYLHQLQNIYFALTQKELEIKL